MMAMSVNQHEPAGVEQRDRLSQVADVPLEFPLLGLVGRHLRKFRGFGQDYPAERRALIPYLF